MAEKSSLYAKWSHEKLIEEIQSYKKRVGLFQSSKEANKERASSVQKRLCSSIISANERTRLEKEWTEYEVEIKKCESWILKWEKTITKCEGALGDRIDSLKKSMQRTVDHFENLCLVVGGGGVGKTHLVALCLKKPVPSVCVSTYCADIPPFMLKNIQLHKGVVSYEVLDERMYTKMMMKSGKDDSLLLLSSPPMSPSETCLSTPSQQISSFTDVDRHLLDIYRSLEEDITSLDGKVLGRVVDIGGQPQLLELLPRFTNEISLGVVVTDLSQNLTDYPISYFYGEDGRPVGEGVKSNLTNEQILRVFLQMIVSQSSKQKNVKVMIVGTHRDLEYRSTETRRKKEKKIKEIVHTFGLEKNIMYSDGNRGNLIFAVNCLNPEEQDYAIGHMIMEETMSKKNSQLVSVPIKHHNLELTIKKLSNSGRVAIPFEEIFHHTNHYYKDHTSMKEGLSVLHKSFRIFYFHEFPDIIFGNPQLLLNFLTLVTIHHIKLSTNPDQMITYTGAWKQFEECGIITKELLLEISDIFDELLTPRCMLEVLEKLLIACKVGDGEYLMPSLLTALASLPQAKVSPWLRWLPLGIGTYLADLISGLASDITMLIHFSLGVIRFGIYCATICELISSYNWKLNGTVSRNRFHFTRPHCAGKVTLIDSFDSFFVVNLEVPSNMSLELLPSMCTEIRDTLLKVIVKVTGELRYTNNQPTVAFVCKRHRNTPHAAEYIRDHGHLLCTKDNSVINRLKHRHRLWLENLPDPFQPAPNLDHNISGCTLSMDKLTLLRWKDTHQQIHELFIINEMSPDWKRASDLLGLTPGHTRRIEMNNNHSVESCCREIMAEWLGQEDGVYNYPRSWEGLCQLLKDMQLSSIAKNLQEIISLTS